MFWCVLIVVQTEILFWFSWIIKEACQGSVGVSSLGLVKLGSTAGTMINLWSPSMTKLLPQVGSWLGLCNLDNGQQWQSWQGDHGDEPTKDMAPVWVLVLAIVVGGCLVVNDGEHPDDQDQTWSWIFPWESEECWRFSSCHVGNILCKSWSSVAPSIHNT